jgi:trigger factor
MDIAVKDLGRCKKEISVSIPAETVGLEMDEALKKIAQQVVLPGFRPGKTPRSILEKKFGEEIAHSVAGDLAQRALAKAVDDNKFELVSEASLRDQHLHAHRGEPMTMVFEIEVKPEFEVSGYKGLSVEREVKPVEDQEIDDVVETLRKQHATFDESADGGYAKGDWLVASVKGEVEGRTFYDKPQETIGGEVGARVLDFDLPGLEEALAGKKAGDTVTLEGAVGDLYEDAAMHGKPARVTLTLADVKRMKLPPVDDALAEKAGKRTLLELRAEIRGKLEEAHRREADRKAEEDLIDQILAKNPFEMAEGPIDRAVVGRAERSALQLRLAGKSASEAVAEVEKKRQEIRQAVERDARAWLVFEKLAKKEKIFALEEDVAKEYERLAREHGRTPTEIRRYYEEKDLVGELRAEILEKKVREFLRSYAKTTDRGAAAAAAG